MLSVRLKQLREDKGMSQAELARRINVGSDSYNKYERAGVQPAYDVLIKLASEFGVSVDYLIGKSDNPYPNNNYDTIDLLRKIEYLEAENTRLKDQNKKYSKLLDTNKTENDIILAVLDHDTIKLKELQAKLEKEYADLSALYA